MTVYNFIASLLSYVFTVIIYFFILGVIRLIYLDVKKMSRFEDERVNVSGVATACLRTLPTRKPLEQPLQKRYMIYREAIIGRNKSCDVSIRANFISARHVRIWYEDGEWLLEDLGSRNGTAINGQRIAQRVMLDPQDEISVGGIRFVFEI